MGTYLRNGLTYSHQQSNPIGHANVIMVAFVINNREHPTPQCTIFNTMNMYFSHQEN